MEYCRIETVKSEAISNVCEIEFYGNECETETNDSISSSQPLLCNWCLVGGRSLGDVVHEQELQWYLNIIGASTEGQVPKLTRIPQICWECRATLKKVLSFSGQVLKSYEKHQILISEVNKESNNDLQQPESVLSRFDIVHAHSIDIQPVINKFQSAVVKEESSNTDRIYKIDIEGNFESLSNIHLLNTKHEIYTHDPDVDSDNLVDVCTVLPASNENDWSISDKTEGTFYECDKCGAGFLMKMPLIRHIFRCYRSTIKRKYTSSKTKKKTKSKQDRKILACNMCKRTFKQRGHLNVHLRTHSSSKPYKCDKCPFASGRSDCLKRHAFIHAERKPYVCDICGAEFIQTSNLAKHMRVHTGVRPYKCDVCPYTSPRNDDVKKHMKRHLNQRRYVCGVCGATFVVAFELTLHLRQRHST